jgi:mono/diheme cytochrome c family protein
MPGYRPALLIAALLAMLLAGCDDFAAQPKNKTWHAAEPLPNDLKWPLTPPEGMVGREPEASPPPLTLALLERGQARFNIYCGPCHGRTGEGDGMIVQRGFPHPPTYHQDRLRQVPTQHFYDVMTNGYGIMYSFAARVAPPDRWAIAAYIRALQLSRDATAADVPADHQADLR